MLENKVIQGHPVLAGTSPMALKVRIGIIGGETIKRISHAINGYPHKALLAVGNIQDGMPNIPEEQKRDFVKIIQNLLKASLAAKELRKFYHL